MDMLGQWISWEETHNFFSAKRKHIINVALNQNTMTQQRSTKISFTRRNPVLENVCILLMPHSTRLAWIVHGKLLQHRSLTSLFQKKKISYFLEPWAMGRILKSRVNIEITKSPIWVALLALEGKPTQLYISTKYATLNFFSKSEMELILKWKKDEGGGCQVAGTARAGLNRHPSSETCSSCAFLIWSVVHHLNVMPKTQAAFHMHVRRERKKITVLP